MQCSSCGLSLPIGSTFCPRCGKPVSMNGEPRQIYEEGNGAVPYIDFGPFRETTSAPSGFSSPSPVGPLSQQTSVPAPGQPFPNTGSQFPQMSGTYMQGQSYAPVGTLPQWQQQQPGIFPLPQAVVTPQQQSSRTRFSAVIIALLMILVLMIIGGGFLIYYGVVLRPASQNAQATAVAHNQPTAQANTPVTQATAPVTATNPQDLYTQVTNRTPTLNDPLTAQDNNDWKDLATQNNCNFTGGTLQLSAPSSQPFSACYVGNASYNNFAYQATMTIVQGDIGGLLFHMDTINRKILFFAINTSGLYELASIAANSSSPNVNILTGGTSAAIVTGPGQQNTLAVIIQGSTINLYINKQFITTVTNNSTTAGTIGMICGSTGNSTASATFKNAQVWAL